MNPNTYAKYDPTSKVKAEYQPFSQPYSLDEPRIDEHRQLKHTHKEPSCTSVDNLIRQRLTGVTVSSNLTGGLTSGIMSQETFPITPLQKDKDEVYSLEVLKEKHAKL